MVLLLAIACAIALYFLCLGALLVLTADNSSLSKTYLNSEVSDEMNAEALERFGYLVDELREQYTDRRRLLLNQPRVGYVRLSSGSRHSARKRRQDLRGLCRVSEQRLIVVHDPQPTRPNPGKSVTH